MKKTHTISMLLVLSLISCVVKDNETLKVTSELPKGVIPANFTVAVTFSRGVVPVDSTNVWTSSPYIEFTPSIEGKFAWQDSSRLVFTPDGFWPGDMKYRARLNTELLKKIGGAKSFKGEDEFEFMTEPFTLRAAEFFYDRIDNRRTVGVKANLEFTYSVDPDDVSKYLRIKIDGEIHPSFKVVTTTSAKVIPVEVGSMTQLEKPRKISIDFSDEFVSPETKTKISLKDPFVYDLPGMEELKIFGHEFGFDGKESWITVKTSQEVDVNTVKSFVQLNPVRTYRIEAGQREGFTLRGNIEPGTAFHLVIKKGVESVLGAKTQNDYEADLIIGNIKPSFRFASSSGAYMLLSGARTVQLKTINMAKLNIRVSQIFQNNIVFFLDGGRSYDYYYEDEGYGEEDEEGGSYRRKYRFTVGNYGRLLENKEVAISGSPNQEITTDLDLSPYLRKDYKGFLLVEIANPDQVWRSTAKLISISDIGLIVKKSKQELQVFAVSLETTEPLSGVKLDLISYNNQTVLSAESDRDGVIRIKNFAEMNKQFPLKLVTATKGEDFNFIHLMDYRVETSRFDVGGKRDIEGLYDAFVYGDRNLYRPGEKIYLSGVVRNLTNELPHDMPVKVKIYNPKGTLVSELQRNLNDQGSFELSHQTDATGQTGEYRFDLLTGSDLFLSSYKVSVEDFVPDRIKISLRASKESAHPGEVVTYQLEALNFFGPPAANRKWEFEGSFEIAPYVSKNFRDFRFYDDGATNYSANPLVLEGSTDNQGRAEMEFPISSQVTSTTLLRAKGRVAVFDESGRPVYQIAQTTIYPKQYMIGVMNLGAYYVSPNTPQKMKIIAVDPNDNPIKGFKAKVEVIRREWYSVLRMHDQTRTLRYVSEKREIVEQTREVTLDASPTEFTYTISRSGDYVVRVSKVGDKGYNQFSFYSYSWATAEVTSFEVNPEARVEVVLDKEVYQPGDRAKILFQTPFSGKMLVTLERNKVFRYQFLDVDKNSASLEVPIEEEYLPNVYVCAVLFRRIKDLNIPLMAGHGFVPLTVEKKSNKISVSINAPDKIRPKTKQKVTISVGQERDVFVTLAAVDEGICQVKNYKTPDPYGHFYAKKALETETFDFFRDLIPEPELKKSSVGGDEDRAIAARANPLGVQRFKPLALWSGILKTGSEGNMDVTLDIPEFSGELRLMALAYKDDQFGSAQRGMKVSDPVVLTPALPRFLSPKDVITMPITAFNTTDKPVSLKFEIETEGPIRADQKSASLEVGANQERFVNVTLRASEQIGKAVVRVKTQAFGESLESETELPVRPISPFVTETVQGFVEGEKSVSHDLGDVFLPFGRKAYVTLSPFPVANFAKELKYLVGYPHGCIEQTTSKAFPQIYLRDIAILLDPSILDRGSPTYFVNEAITKIASMQMNDGGFSYWPGGGYSNPWSTVYATHFLVEAKKAGYAVPEGVLKNALGASALAARNKQTVDYYYYENNRTLIRRIADKTAVYALYVLALAGQPDVPLMNFYRTSRSLLTNDTQYLLAGAFAMSGDKKTYLELLPPKFAAEDAQRMSGGWYDSPIRANAIILNVLLDTEPNNQNIPRYMEYLSKLYKDSYWYSTQDNAFTLLGFGKAARMAGAGKMEGTVNISGKQLPYKGGNQKFEISAGEGRVSISMKGSGRVYYSIVTEGIRKDGLVKIEDKNLRVRREFFDRNGAPVSLESVRQNSLIIVKLTLNSDVDRLENVALTDLLPGGFEIENPRLTETTQYSFIRGAARPEYIDIRDDRINYYANFGYNNRQQVFYYMVRAVTRGEFQYAPVAAEAMYDGNYYSASGRGVLKVAD